MWMCQKKESEQAKNTGTNGEREREFYFLKERQREGGIRRPLEDLAVDALPY